MRLKDVDIAPYSTILLDRDGTVNVHIVGDYVRSPKQFVFVPGAKEAMAAMHKAGKQVYIITNQRGVGRGLMTEEDLTAVHRYMLKQVEEAGGHIDGIYCCTATDANDPRRKPNTGMWQELLNDHPDIRPEATLMIGDSDSDEVFARNCGIDFCKVEDTIG